MTLRPCLIVGVGGSGGKTLRFLRAQLLRQLRSHGVDELPAAWQMLYVDVPTEQEGGGEETQDGLPPKLLDRDYLGLVNESDIRYSTVDQAVVASAPIDSFLGWRPSPQDVSVPIYKGAGQYRTVGRMISVYALSQIAESVRGAVTRLTSSEVHSELAEVSRRLGFETSTLTGPADTWVFVITSLAGGTGSGVFLDVCDVIRASAGAATWADESLGIMYTGEVFGELRPSDRAGVNANSLASLSEVMAGYWRTAPSEAARKLFNASRLQAPARSGPRYPFLVGASNEEGVVTGKQVEIYGVVGNALASFLTSPNLQNGMAAYTTTNWNSKATNNHFDSPLLRNLTDEQPFTALGVSRLSLGRDRFADYATDRLAKASIDHALSAHLVNVSLEETTEHEVVDKRAQELLQPFLRKAFLNERTEKLNDVIDALRPSEQPRRLGEMRASIMSNISSLSPMSGPDWERSVFAELRDQRGRLMDDDSHLVGQEASELREQAEVWVDEIQSRFVNLTADFIALRGLSITHRLVGLVRQELETVAVELRTESEALNQKSFAVKRVLSEALVGVGKKVGPTHDQVQHSVSAGIDCLRAGAEAHVRSLAAGLLQDFVTGFIEPFEASIGSARERLQLQESNTNLLQGPIVSAWPGSGAVPDDYGPRHNEFLIESHATFNGVYEEILNQSVSADTPAQALQQSIRSVLSGVGLDDLDRHRAVEDGDSGVRLSSAVSQGAGAGQTMITIVDRWTPVGGEFRRDTALPNSARFELSLRVGDHIQLRARSFVNDPDTAIGRYVRESLRRYLDETEGDVEPVEAQERLERFKDRFRELVRSSAPLVNVSSSAKTLAHPKASLAGESVRTFSMIPFGDADSAAYKAVKEIDASLGLEIDGDTFRDSDASVISVFSFLAAPMQPHVFSSVVEPIVADWRQCQARLEAEDPDPVGSFWKLRRSRGLVDFIPLPAPSRRAIIRGWFIGKMLGLIQVERGAHPRVKVWNEQSGDWATMPRPMLGGPMMDSYDELPRVLESFPVALITQGTAQGADRPLAAYERLAEWGWDATYQSGQLEYRHAGELLQRWVLDGRTETGAPLPQTKLAGPVGGSSEERMEHCRKTIEQSANAYIAKAGSAGTINHQIPHEFFDLSPIVELEEDLKTVFGDLLRGLDGIAASGEEEPLL